MDPNFPILNSTPQFRLKIGELSRLANKSTRTLRLYEEHELLSSFRTDGGHRLYSEDAVERLRFIDRLQSLGFSLHQMRDLLGEIGGNLHGPEAMSRVRAIYRSRLDETRSQVKTLEALAGELEDAIAYLEACPHCSPSTLLDSCACCEQSHSVEAPTLITGIHKDGGEK